MQCFKGIVSFVLVIMYCMPDPHGISIDDYILLINKLPPQHRILSVGDFNLD